MSMIDYITAHSLLAGHLIELGTQQLPLMDALHRVLAQDLHSDRDYPPFNRSAMDGYAVNSEWYNALDQKSLALQGTCLAGQSFELQVDPSKALKIMTGAPVPKGLDAVIPVEDSVDSSTMIQFGTQHTTPNQNIARQGEDAQKGAIVLKKGTLLSPQNLQVLATLGIAEVTVSKPPSIALITTGDEVKDLGQQVDWFQIRNSNKYSLLAELERTPCPVALCLHVLDDPKELELALQAALKADIVLLTGGVSMGDADFVPGLLAQQGIQKVFHKIAMKPGKPIWFGQRNNKAVFGLPGNPLSTFHCYHLLVKPYLHLVQGHSAQKAVLIPLNETIRPAPIDRFFPFQILEGHLKLKPFNGSGDITASLNTDGIVYLPKNKLLGKDDQVSCYFY